MKKGISIFLLGILLISPLVFAQEQTQIYSGFDRFIDDVRMFFSSEENKVMLSLEVREKELNSAIINLENGNDAEAEKNLERATEKLQYVQSKVSKDIAEDVMINVNETINKINNENLSDSFGNYILEEEKTQLTAKLVIEFEGKEGQTLTREIVTNYTTGKSNVNIVIDGDNGTRIMEIVGEIAVVENQIAENHDDGLIPEVKTYVAGDGTMNEEPLSEPDLNQFNPDLYDPDARAPGDTMDDPDGPDGYAEGTTAEGTNILAE